jgi:hypothetical protein
MGAPEPALDSVSPLVVRRWWRESQLLLAMMDTVLLNSLCVTARSPKAPCCLLHSTWGRVPGVGTFSPTSSRQIVSAKGHLGLMEKA